MVKLGIGKLKTEGNMESILDNDFYKFTMQQAVLEKYPNAIATMRFKNRRKSNRFNENFAQQLDAEIQKMAELELKLEEKGWLKKAAYFLKPQYIEYLANYRFDPSEVSFEVNNDGELNLSIKGPWHSSILWEVPLMSTISELYFKEIEPDWDYQGQRELIREKGQLLSEAGCIFGDFGTRRRRSFTSQEIVTSELKDLKSPNYVGTSNVYLAYKTDTKPLGTMAHEWIMGVSGLEGLRHANRFALKRWQEVYEGSLGIALPDTFGTDAFFEDFDAVASRQFDGIRHDSGSPFDFVEKTIKHYESKKIDPLTKTILFSDNLTTNLAIELQNYCKNKIRTAFGIGTHFTNHFPLYIPKALNMVIKLESINGIPVVKISDELSKAVGDLDALRVARWTFFGTPLDAPLESVVST